jgi:hypothetical protein
VWYRWAKVQRADVPPALRCEFEQLGEAVVAQVVGRPLSHSVETVGVPHWAAAPVDRQHALAWLREQYSRRERREDRGEAIEIAILLLVAIEAIPILLHMGQL